MTENTWPRTEGLDPLDTDLPTQQVPTASNAQHVAPPASASSDAGSTKDAAKAEASDVAEHASDAAANVTATAKEEAANVAAEVKSSAADLFTQAKSDFADQAGSQQQKAAEGLRSVSDELHSLVSSAENPGMATDLVRQAAERTSSIASWLEGRDASGLLADVKTYARHKPGTFLLLAAGAGLLAGRLTRSLKAGAPKSSASGTGAPRSGAIPPVPVAPPVVEPSVLGVTDTYSHTSVPPVAGFEATDPWGTEPVATGPLHTANPLDNDPLSGERQ